ncbi:hypothetical protein SFRURICE_020207 [Spodoptera frugiperda]|uniref:SFRICE_016037 n=1 Tax=Spodoptera frugiperda TaxID=7108 RepID=A0A2H1WRF8_SPOFR|nr:hypothetical protein SFRURICE_020207 [Spodoptera frugiperda]
MALSHFKVVKISLSHKFLTVPTETRNTKQRINFESNCQHLHARCTVHSGLLTQSMADIITVVIRRCFGILEAQNFRKPEVPVLYSAITEK